MAEEQEKNIIRLLAKGDEEGTGILFRSYHRLLCAYCMRYLVSREDAEDIVQAVFISLWQNWRGRKFSGSLEAYLFGAVNKAALKTMREAGKRYFEDIEISCESFLDEVLGETAERQERIRAELHIAIGQLPKHPRRVITDIIFNGKSYKTVAAEMNISVNTVKTHYIRALQKLRQTLGAQKFYFLFFAVFSDYSACRVGTVNATYCR